MFNDDTFSNIKMSQHNAKNHTKFGPFCQLHSTKQKQILRWRRQVWCPTSVYLTCARSCWFFTGYGANSFVERCDVIKYSTEKLFRFRHFIWAQSYCTFLTRTNSDRPYSWYQVTALYQMTSRPSVSYIAQCKSGTERKFCHKILLFYTQWQVF
jgi:hypothetical protein